jgi:2-polyprenyl-3-methyl-5-hydroxy-6-metoxy-1,4-benzoquinol methylase
MVEDPPLASMAGWLADVREYVKKKSPELLPMLEVYSGEARFGRRYIAPDLMRLPPDATVLEIGAGSLLLSCQLVREGFQVTALEPIGHGFSHFKQLRELVIHQAEILGCLPRMLDHPAEMLSERGLFDYAFSVNVMEHVEDVILTITKVSASLKPGASYRFTCPNYLFPYEPHFNIPTLFSKKLTEKFFRNNIFANMKNADPEGTWKSLNWINIYKIKAGVKQLPELELSFKRDLLIDTLERISFDKEFALRRSKCVSLVILVLVKLRLHYLVGFVPAMFQPIIDCIVTRTEGMKA